MIDDESNTQTILFHPVAVAVSLMEAIITLGSTTLTALEELNSEGSSIVVVGSQTLTMGGASLTTDGETIWANPSGLTIASGATTQLAGFSSVATTTSSSISSTSVASLSSKKTEAASTKTSSSEAGLSHCSQ